MEMSKPRLSGRILCTEGFFVSWAVEVFGERKPTIALVRMIADANFTLRKNWPDGRLAGFFGLPSLLPNATCVSMLFTSFSTTTCF